MLGWQGMSFFLARFLALLGNFFFCLDLAVELFLLLVLRILDAHAHELVFECHDGVAQEHARRHAVHEGKEILGLLRTEAWAVTAVADRLRDAVRTAIHLRHDGCEECRALRAELVAGRAVMLVAVHAERLSDVRFFLRNVVLDLYRLSFRQKTRKNTHVAHLSWGSVQTPRIYRIYCNDIFADLQDALLFSMMMWIGRWEIKRHFDRSYLRDSTGNLFFWDRSD